MIILSKKIRGFYGWSHGFLQPVIFGQLNLKSDIAIEWKAIDPMMRDLFCDAGEMAGFKSLKTPDAVTGHPVVERLLYWAASLQRKAGLPVFEGGRILSAMKMPEEMVAYSVALPYGDPDAAAASLELVIDVFNKLNGMVGGHRSGDLQKNVRTAVLQVTERLVKKGPQGSNTLRFLQAAHLLGVPWRYVAANTYEFGQGAKSRWLDSSFSDRTSAIGSNMAFNKAIAARVLKQAGLPVPEHFLAGSPETAIEIAKTIGFPVVVKPMALDGGRGVSAGLKDAQSVRQAFETARKYMSKVLVEKHIYGRDYRLYVHDGAFIWAIERTPGGVTGNGRQTVSSLVAELNNDPRRGFQISSPLKNLKMDEEAMSLLKEEALSPDSVPESGRFIRLRRSSNISSGGTPVAVTEKVHPDNRQLAERAARAMRLDLAGVDLLMPDISRSWLQVGGAICEVNAKPQLGAVTGVHLYGEVLKKLLVDDGRIPLVLVIGEPGKCRTEKTAAGIQQQLRRGTLRIGLASSQGAKINDRALVMIGGDFFSTGRAVLSSCEVDGAVLTANIDDVLKTGLPFDSCDVMVFAGFNLSHGKNQTKYLTVKTRFREACHAALPHAKKGVVVNMQDPLCRRVADFPGICFSKAGNDVDGLVAATMKILNAV